MRSTYERLWTLERRLKTYRRPGSPDYEMILYGALPYLIGYVEAMEVRAHYDDAIEVLAVNHETPCAACSALRGLDQELTSHTGRI